MELQLFAHRPLQAGIVLGLTSKEHFCLFLSRRPRYAHKLGAALNCSDPP